ncbi:uncharacterized protein LOC121863264 isoform X2 [Homarus americanus]|uniref:uncharacterized protein LOC121863264 isoform X2 n=1 Tax=Homarus americanus TaxID=6706 RepID=UPI001C439B4B|nr:uncharacterized protein LOC121863264 isoform X2 [Homarus americanus]
MLPQVRHMMNGMRGRGGSCLASTVIAPRVTLSSCCVTFKVGASSPQGPRYPPSAALSLLHIRDFHSRKFSRNVEFFTSSDVPLPQKTMKVASALSQHERPLTLLFCWLMARERHIKKYAQLYTTMGFDVLKIRLSPFDLIRPTKGSQLVADQVLEFLHANPSHTPLLVHGLSVGGYLAMEVMVKIHNNMQKHGHLLDRFVGQIWDSGVDIDGIPDGVPRAITNNKALQRNIKKYLLYIPNAGQIQSM